MPPREWRVHCITGSWYAVEWRDIYPEGPTTWRKIAHVLGEDRANKILELAKEGKL